MKFYVTAVVFTADLTHVVLIHKSREARPELDGWHCPGGHLEPNEVGDELAGARRELYEETGLDITRGWKKLPTIERQACWNFCFTVADDVALLARTKETEPVTLYPVAALDAIHLSDYTWSEQALIYAALERHGHPAQKVA